MNDQKDRANNVKGSGISLGVPNVAYHAYQINMSGLDYSFAISTDNF